MLWSTSPACHPCESIGPSPNPVPLEHVDSAGLTSMMPDQAGMNSQRTSRKSERWLLLILLLSLPLTNPWVRGDGVGYYALARAPLIQHNLDFTADYQHANTGFRELRLDTNGQPLRDFRTSTGHLDNHFSVGPAILWAPSLIIAHLGVLAARALGSGVTADGFSAPYRIAMALTTVVLGFLGLLLAFRVARRYVEERWALLAAIAVWGATSLAVYMYFNPSWSHAQSAFVVALFFWYWLETRADRTLFQWLFLGLVAGLMLDVYYVNVVLLLLLLPEALAAYASALRSPSFKMRALSAPLAKHAVFAFTILVCMLPTFLAHSIIYGSPFASGYIPIRFWHWKSPYLVQVLFSSDHGLFAWTPLIAFSFIGLFLFSRRNPSVGGPVLLAILAFYYVIASYPDWDGISSFGNRFFVSLTVFLVLGLAVLLQRVAGYFRSRTSAVAAISSVLACFVIWNLGLIFQWGTRLIPARGQVVWGEVVHNQFVVVPRELSSQVAEYLLRRRQMMNRIEQHDAPQR